MAFVNQATPDICPRLRHLRSFVGKQRTESVAIAENVFNSLMTPEDGQTRGESAAHQGCPDERELKDPGCGRARGKSAPLKEKPSLHYRGTSVPTAKRKAIGEN